MCLNGTHPFLLAVFKPFQIVLVKLAVWIVCGQCYESTSVPVLFPIRNSARAGAILMVFEKRSELLVSSEIHSWDVRIRIAGRTLKQKRTGFFPEEPSDDHNNFPNEQAQFQPSTCLATLAKTLSAIGRLC